MFYITGVSEDAQLYEITNCITHETLQIGASKLPDYDIRPGRYYKCIELPDSAEMRERLDDYPDAIACAEDGRYFLFTPINSVKTIEKPKWVVVRYAPIGYGHWQLAMLTKEDRGTTQLADNAWQTEKKGDAIRKANSINKYYEKMGWPPANYTAKLLSETLLDIKTEHEKIF